MSDTTIENLSGTELQLFIQHRTALLPLATVCTEYLGIGEDVGRRRVATGRLPVAAFRVGDSRKSPLVVRISDLARHIDQRAAQAEALRRRSEV